MKKRTALLLSVVLVLAVLMGVTLTASGASLAEAYSDMTVRAQFEALSQAQADAVEAHSVLYSSFLSDTFEEVFPDDYGGDYVKNNILHICIVDLSNADITPYKTLLAGYEDVTTFEDVEYSLNTLISAGWEIGCELMDNNISVTGWGPDVLNNTVLIDVEQDSLAEMDLCSLQGADGRYVFAENPYDVPVTFKIGTVIDPLVLESGTTIDPCSATETTDLVGG